MKYNCNKTLDYFHEMTRLCNSTLLCVDCPLEEMDCENPNQLTIDTLQDWSDGQMPAWEQIIRCKNCRHNLNCDIQFAANATENFGCMAGERKVR